MNRLYAIVFSAVFLFVAAAAAQQAGITPPKFDPSLPLHIEAERLEADHGDEVIRFEGKVVATQDDAVLKCDVLLVYYHSAAQGPADDQAAALAPAGGEVKRLIALGRVELAQGERRATCERAEYDHHERTITLSGSPVVAQGADSLRGDRILIHVREQRVKILGGKSGRVSVTINPGGKGVLPEENEGKE